MKTTLQFACIIFAFFTLQAHAQNKTYVNAMNTEISDNLDLTAVSSIFGESDNLNDFERRLNDPKLQISNLDLNNDNRVDYLRVIESVEKRTHIIIIQSVIGRDLYQDVATIEIEKKKHNTISIQIVGNSYLYGQNYIYEPEYCYTPQIYATFWGSYYQPYYSSWTWNYYPTYYYAWNPYPVYRYRENVYGCINYYNNYNYVNYRSCNRASVIYNSYSCNGYERQHPEYAFSRRNYQVSNRYELDKKRYSNSYNSRNEVAYNRNNSKENNRYKTTSQRDYSQNRTSNSRETSTQRVELQRDYSQNRASNSRETSTQRVEPQRDYSQNRASNPRETSTQRVEPQRDYSQNRTSSSRETSPQRVEPQRDNSQNRTSTPRENNTQRTESQNNTNYASRSSNRRA
jgi:hypothetical protein